MLTLTSTESASGARFTASDSLLRQAVNALPDAMIVLDAHGCVSDMNPAAEALTGWTLSLARGRPLDEVFPVMDEPGGEEHLGRLCGDRLISWSTAAMHAEDGSPCGAVVLCRDVSRRQREEETRLRTSRLEAVGVLAGGIAHDFNNLLTGIMASVSVAEVLERRGQAVGERLRAALLACERARSLTQQLLTFARGGEPVRTVAAVDRVVRDAAQLAFQGTRTQARVDIAADVWAIDVDVGQIGQVLLNLLRNADQAMPDGGTVDIEVRNVRRGVAPYVAIRIADRGWGIPIEHRTRIFDPFFTTKPRGSGLGLATVHSVLRRHAGHIEVEARNGGGTVFTISLPAVPGARVDAPNLEDGLLGGEGRVLVMDDEPGVLEVAGEALRALGYEVRFAADGAEAVDIYTAALRSGAPYDALIMDLTVPGGIGGTEAIRRIRAVDPDVRALVSSGYSNDPVLANPRDYGFRGVIGKPWRIQDLDHAMRTLLAPA